MYLRFSSALLLALLAGCAAQPPRPAVDDPEAVYRERVEDLAARDRWALSGRVGIQIDGKGWNADLDWRQQPDGYRLHLFGPFGKLVAQVQSDGNGVTLTADDNRVVRAASADELVRREVGWPLPVDGLRDWILGRPVRGNPEFELSLDDWGRPSRLRQDGWEIDYLRYREDLVPALPDRVQLVHEDIRVNLVIDEWRLGR